jgi:hypothetical protein
MDVPMLFTLCGVYRLHILGISDTEFCECTVILEFFKSSTEVKEKRSPRTLTDT